MGPSLHGAMHAWDQACSKNDSTCNHDDSIYKSLRGAGAKRSHPHARHARKSAMVVVACRIQVAARVTAAPAVRESASATSSGQLVTRSHFLSLVKGVRSPLLGLYGRWGRTNPGSSLWPFLYPPGCKVWKTFQRHCRAVA
eukprot:356488-Chlamydomonas_euryale.AAC.7